MRNPTHIRRWGWNVRDGRFRKMVPTSIFATSTPVIWNAFIRCIMCCKIVLLQVSPFQAMYLFGLAIPLFIENNDDTHRVKWSLWVVHKLLLTAVYGFILFIYHSRWRERLPGQFALFFRFSLTLDTYLLVAPLRSFIKSRIVHYCFSSF